VFSLILKWDSGPSNLFALRTRVSQLSPLKINHMTGFGQSTFYLPNVPFKLRPGDLYIGQFQAPCVHLCS
jgi:hypothetical protein